MLTVVRLVRNRHCVLSLREFLGLPMAIQHAVCGAIVVVVWMALYLAMVPFPAECHPEILVAVSQHAAAADKKVTGCMAAQK